MSQKTFQRPIKKFHISKKRASYLDTAQQDKKTFENFFMGHCDGFFWDTRYDFEYYEYENEFSFTHAIRGFTFI